MILHTIPVELAERSYPIYLGAGNLDDLGRFCTHHGIPHRVVVLADRNSAHAVLKRARSSLTKAGFNVSSIVIPHGERQKNLKRAAAVHGAMLKMQIPRNAALVALGGGVVGDIGGFVASTYRRGVTFVQCPTTLLSQVDSSVGGKNGVNHPLSKNAIGTFHQPAFVFSDVEVLVSLPRREVISGLGEILKYPIVADPPLLSFIESHLDDLLNLKRDPLVEVVKRCLQIKSDFVSRDEKEISPSGGRVFLNVGHAVGHPLETLSHYTLRHGEAVLLGILVEGHIAVQKEGFPRSDLDRFVEIYHRLNRRLALSGLKNSEIVRTTMGKSRARFVLPRKLGDVVVVQDVTANQLLEGLRFFKGL